MNVFLKVLKINLKNYSMEKICKENWSYGNIKELIAQLPQNTCKIVKDEPSLLIIQTFSVEPFRELFVSVRTLKKGEDSSSACHWCYCVPKNNRNWGEFAEISYKQYTKNGKNQQYIAFDFTKEFSTNNACVVAFTVVNDKITWPYLMNGCLSDCAKDCNPMYKFDRINKGKKFSLN